MASARDVVSAAVARVAANKDAWLKVTPQERIGLLRQIIANTERHAEEWGRKGGEVRGLANGKGRHAEGFPYLASAGMTGAYCNALIDTYTSIGATGRPVAPKKVRTVAGKTAVQTFPNTTWDKITFPGYRCEIFLEGSELSQAEEFKAGRGLCAILGAGNFEAGTDILTKLFIENKVAVYKPNPVNAAAQDVSAKVFAPLVELGFLAYVDGEAEVGAALVHHPDVDEVIITGGCATYDRIMWGAPSEQDENKRKRAPLVKKRLDAELGGVGPVIVVPGTWTNKEIEHQAQAICAAKYTNSGHICASPQILVVDKDWPQRQQFVDALCREISLTPAYPSYYPGSCEKASGWLASSDKARVLQDAGPNTFERQVRPIFIPDAKEGDRIIREEAFMLVFGETAISGGNDPAGFLTAAVKFCNEKVFGSLCATILCPPSVERVAKLDEAVANLNYGSIGVNVWGATTNFFPVLPWGAYPGHDSTDIQSGTGKIGNTMMVDRAVKGVVYSPFFSPAHSKRPSAGDYKTLKRTMWLFIYPTYTRLTALLSAAVFGL